MNNPAELQRADAEESQSEGNVTANGRDVVGLLGASAVRVALLRYVLAREECTAIEAMEALGLTRNGVGKHLDGLTAAGFLIERRATHPRGSGGVIYWSADRELIAAELWRFTGDLLDYAPSAGGGG